MSNTVYFGQPSEAMDESTTPRLSHTVINTTAATGVPTMPAGTVSGVPAGDTTLAGMDASSYAGMADHTDSTHLLQAQQPYPGKPHTEHELPIAAPPHAIQNEARMSLFGYDTGISGIGADASSMSNPFGGFVFDTVDPTTGFPMTALGPPFDLPPSTTPTNVPGLHPGAHLSLNTVTGSSTQESALHPSRTRSFPILDADLMDNMLTFSDLDLNHIANADSSSTLDAASLYFFGVVDPHGAGAAPTTGLEGSLNHTTVRSLPPSSFISTGNSMDVDTTKNLPPSSLTTMPTSSSPRLLPQPEDPTPADPSTQQGMLLPPQQLQHQQPPPGPLLSSLSSVSIADGQLSNGGSGTSTPTRTPTSTVPQGPLVSSASATSLMQALSTQLQPQTSPQGQMPPPEKTTGPSSAVAPSGPPPPPRISTKPAKNYYSSSGFDMLRALYYVSSRPNPEIAIGPVDLSCAFVVCDATLDDFPIIYVSDNFQHLTGYSSYDILGQNCRFLQAPDGQVQAGSRRKFTDNKAVHNIKQKLINGRELQQSLINYRKGGKPFLNLLTMIPIPWDDYKNGYKYFIGLQIDIVESPDAISGQGTNSMRIDYTHSSVPQYIWDPPNSDHWGTDQDRTLGMDDVSALLQQFNNKGLIDAMNVSGSDIVGSLGNELYRQTWDKMLLENMDDVVHVLSLKGVFLYLSPSCKTVLEYDSADLVGNSLSSICHPSDIVPVTREMRDTQAGQPINLVFRVRRKRSGYTWFESYGSLLVEQGKGRKCIVLVGRKRPAFALRRCDVDINGGIGDTELWTKLSTSGMILHMSSNARSLLDQQPDTLMGTSMQDLMRKESRAGFNRSLEKVRRGIIASCRHEVQHRRGQVLQAMTIFYPGDADRGERPTFILGQTRLFKPYSSRQPYSIGGAGTASVSGNSIGDSVTGSVSGAEEVGRAGATGHLADPDTQTSGFLSSAGGGGLPLGSQDVALASDDNIFGELKTTRCTSWQYELRQMEKANRLLAEELGQLLTNRKKRKRRKGVGNVPRDCANCHTRQTPEWRRGPSGQRDLCNSCGLRWAKQVGRVSPRNSSRGGGDTASKKSMSPAHSSSQHDFSEPLSTSAPRTASTIAPPLLNSTSLNSSVNTAGWPTDSSILQASLRSAVFSMPPMVGALEISTIPEIAEEREAA